MNAQLKASIAYANSQHFNIEGVRVVGVLVNADIAAGTCYGDLYYGDRAPGDEFFSFKAVGADKRNGYNIVIAEGGVGHVIVTFAEHAKARGMDQLKAHIAFNPEHYAELRRA